MAHQRNQSLRSERDTRRRKRVNGSKAWEERMQAGGLAADLTEGRKTGKRRRKRDSAGKLTKYDF